MCKLRENKGVCVLGRLAETKENNKYYEGNENNQIIVYLENKQIQENTQEQYNQLIQADRNIMTTELPTYSCKVMSYNSDGRIKEIKFNKK